MKNKVKPISEAEKKKVEENLEPISQTNILHYFTKKVYYRSYYDGDTRAEMPLEYGCYDKTKLPQEFGAEILIHDQAGINNYLHGIAFGLTHRQAKYFMLYKKKKVNHPTK